MVSQRVDLVAFVGWGRFENIHFDRLSREHKAGNHKGSLNDPAVGLENVLDLIEKNYGLLDYSRVFPFGFYRHEADELRD